MKKRQNQIIVFIAIIAVVVVAFIVVIALSGNATTYATDYASIPQSRTADGAYVLGNPEAPITIIEFADWACPHCQEYRPVIERFIEEFVATGQAKFEFRVFPTAGGQYTIFAGQMADCAENQQEGAFWQAYSLLYSLAQSGRYQDAGRQISNQLGLNYSQMLTCASENSTRVSMDTAFGQARGVSGTPAVMVRYNDGDAQWITFNNTTYNRGTVPFEVLAALVASTST